MYFINVIDITKTCQEASHQKESYSSNGATVLYAQTWPIGALLFCYMLLRSVVVTLWQGGVTWRETFYPLEELKRGVV